MKKIKFLLTIVLCITGIVLHATIRTVNNAPGTSGPLDYDAIQAALDASTAGDTILISASSVKYSDVNITKRIVLIGTGFGTENRTTVNSITFKTSNADGTVLKGMFFNSTFTDYSMPVSNLLIERCYFDYFFNLYGSNNIATSCVFMYTIALYGNNVRITNSVIGDGVNYSKYDSNVLENCLFFGVNSSAYSSGSALTIKNSIFYYSSCNIGGITYMNNLSFGNGSDYTFPTSSTNVNNILNTDPNFVNITVTQEFSFTDDYHLKVTSPAIGKGIGAVDLGIYGGSSPFAYHYETAIPKIIYIQSSNAVVPKDGTLEINVKAVSVE